MRRDRGPPYSRSANSDAVLGECDRGDHQVVGSDWGPRTFEPCPKQAILIRCRSVEGQ